MEVKTLGSSLACLKRYADSGDFTDEVKQEAEQVEKLIYAGGIIPPQIPATSHLCFDLLEPVLEKNIQQALAKKNARALLLFNQVLLCARVARTALIIYSPGTTQADLAKAIAVLETSIFNSEFVAASSASIPKRTLLRSTDLLGEALGAWEHRCVSPLREKLVFLRQLIASVTVSDEIFTRKEYFAPALLFQIHSTYPNERFTTDLIEKFAVELLKGHEQKYLIVQGSVSFNTTVFKVVFSNRQPRMIYQKGEKWHFYREVTQGKWHMANEAYSTLNDCLEHIVDGHTPVDLPNLKKV